MRWFAMLLCLAGTVRPDALCADALRAEPLRSYGYTIGDVIDQRFHINNAPVNRQAIELPETGRAGPWLDRQSVTIAYDNENQLWLSIRYQIINSPDFVLQTSLPAVRVMLDSDQTLSIDEQPISIAPLIPATTDPGQAFPAMQPDQAPQLAPLETATLRVQWTAFALAASLCSWAIWWLTRHVNDRKRLPFAQALHQLKKMDDKQRDDDPLAWVTVHRAFNQAAGKTISSRTLPDLLQRQPWLAPHKKSIESFFDNSARRFFDEAQAHTSLSLLELTTGLYRAEKQHASRRVLA